MSNIKTMDLAGEGDLLEVKTVPVITPDVYRAILYKATLEAREFASNQQGVAITLRLSLSVANRWALNNGFRAGYSPLSDELFTSMVGEATPALDRYLKNSGLPADQIQELVEKASTPIAMAILDHLSSSRMQGGGKHE